MKKSPFSRVSVGSSFLFRGQRFKKVGTSLAADSKRSRIIFDRDTEVEIVDNEETSITPDVSTPQVTKL